MTARIPEEDLLDAVRRMTELAGELGDAFFRERQRECEETKLHGWARYRGRFDELLSAIQDTRATTQSLSPDQGAIANWLEKAESDVRAIKEGMQSTGSSEIYLESYPVLKTIQKQGLDIVRNYADSRASSEFETGNGSSVQGVVEFTRLDWYGEDPQGHIEFLEWVLSEIKEQAAGLSKYGRQNVEKQLAKAIPWPEARKRIDALSFLPADVVEPARRLFGWHLSAGSVEQLAVRLKPAMWELRAAWEQWRVAPMAELTPTADSGSCAISNDDDPLARYFGEVRAVEDSWITEEIECLQVGKPGRHAGSSPWNGEMQLLREIERRNGLGPEDPRVYSIAAYQAEHESLVKAWGMKCAQNGWDRPENTTIDKQHHRHCNYRHEALLADLKARHFGRLDAADLAVRSRRTLWAYITLIAIPGLERLRVSGGRLSTLTRKDEELDIFLGVVLSAQTKLKIPGAQEAPYPRFSLQESIDKLFSIANRLEQQEKAAANETPLARAQINAEREYVARLTSAAQEADGRRQLDRLEAAWGRIYVFMPTVHDDHGVDYESWSRNLKSFCEVLAEEQATEAFLQVQPASAAEAIALSLIVSGIQGGQDSIDRRLLELSKGNDHDWMRVFNHNDLFYRAKRRDDGIPTVINASSDVEPAIPVATIDAVASPMVAALAKLEAIAESDKLSAAQIAVVIGLKPEVVRKRLDRYRRKNDDCFVELENTKPREPRFLYRIRVVRHVLKELIASSHRPAK